jgi:1-acyl-sn-glycerol-3-phosphate acyltransferase
MRSLSAVNRLVLLWLSQIARVMGDGCLRLIAMLELAAAGERHRLAAYHLSMALFIAPFVVLSPLNGCLSNALPRRWVLSASAALALLLILAFGAAGHHWAACTLLVGFAAALNSAARYAMLPAAARDAGVALPRLAAWIELGAAVAVVSSFAIGLALPQEGWPEDGSALGVQAVLVLAGLNAICLLGALPASFPSDHRRPEPPLAAVAGFFTDLNRIVRRSAAGASLLALAGFQALVTAGAGALVAGALESGHLAMDVILPAILFSTGGAALGSAAASLIGHPRRCLGLVPPGAVGLLVSLAWAVAVRTPDDPMPVLPCTLLGFMGGMINAPLRAAYLAAVPADARGNATAVMNATVYGLTVLLGGVLIGLTHAEALTSGAAQLWFLSCLAGVGMVLAWLYLFTPFMDLMFAALLWPSYDIRAHGPGKDVIPTTGPLVVVVNHSSYFDPFWVGKILPRRFTPMMSSVFYDKPGIRWLMRRVVGAIRVEVSRYRREAPELALAADVLRRGGCLLVFPEAILRRKEEQILRNFGRGVWHLLREQPQVPVLVCWIEGGWGSFASYKGGPPFTNKRMDRRRRIDVAIAEPQLIPPEVLADQRLTRAHLMRACLGCRAYLGLEVPGDVPAEDEEPPDAGAVREGEAKLS